MTTLCLSFVGFFGTAHACTLPKSYYKHVSCTSVADVFLAVKDDGSPVALLNRQGTKTADLFAYDAVLARQMNSGLLPVKKGNKIGYINAQGRIIIPLIYDSLGGGNWARPATNGRIVVKKGGAWGVINTQGGTVVGFDRSINYISDFNASGATIRTRSGSYRVNHQGQTANQAAAQAQAAQTQRRSLQPSHPQIPQTPSAAPWEQTADSLWVDSLTGSQPLFTPHQQDGKWGFVDSNGVPMIVYAFDEVRPYQRGLAAVRQGTHWGFIDTTGQLVIEFRFDDAGVIKDSLDAPELPEPFVFYQDKAWIGNLNNGTKLCIDMQGNNVTCSSTPPTNSPLNPTANTQTLATEENSTPSDSPTHQENSPELPPSDSLDPLGENTALANDAPLPNITSNTTTLANDTALSNDTAVRDTAPTPESTSPISVNTPSQAPLSDSQARNQMHPTPTQNSQNSPTNPTDLPSQTLEQSTPFSFPKSREKLLYPIINTEPPVPTVHE
ncbi:MAG: WG repeat-containing protein [Moraxella sp.]|nr:WG repeat-containing protein [Moraxella sp.]